MPIVRKVGLGPGDIVLDKDRAPPTEICTAAPTFRPISVVAKRSPISTSAELLFSDAENLGKTQTGSTPIEVPNAGE